MPFRQHSREGCLWHMQPKQYTSTMHDLDITDAYCILGYTTRVAGVQVISKNVTPPSHQRDNIISQEFNLQSFFSLYGQKWTFKVKARTFGLYAVYTKTIIDLSVGESGGYLPSHFAAW